MEMGHKVEEHTFSVEMKSKGYLNHVSLSDKSAEPVLIQGELGRLEEVCFQDEVTLEIRGTKGTLRIDMSRRELEALLAKGARQKGAQTCSTV